MYTVSSIYPLHHGHFHYSKAAFSYVRGFQSTRLGHTGITIHLGRKNPAALDFPATGIHSRMGPPSLLERIQCILHILFGLLEVVPMANHMARTLFWIQRMNQWYSVIHVHTPSTFQTILCLYSTNWNSIFGRKIYVLTRSHHPQRSSADFKEVKKK